MEIYIESMTKFVIKTAPWKELVVRCWRQEKDYDSNNSDLSKAAALEAIKGFDGDNKYTIAERILNVDRMNAVEVIDETGAGIVLYKDWP